MGAKKVLPFKGTAEQEAKLYEVIAHWKGKDGGLMPVLQEAQEIYGYLPEEVQMMISEGMHVSMSEIYGVITFYSQFNLSPKGKYKIGVCLGTACYVQNAGDVFERLKIVLGLESGECTEDGIFSLDGTRCLGCCGLAPVLMVNDDVYGRLKPEEVDKIVEKYRKLEA